MTTGWRLPPLEAASGNLISAPGPGRRSAPTLSAALRAPELLLPPGAAGTPSASRGGTSKNGWPSRPGNLLLGSIWLHGPVCTRIALFQARSTARIRNRTAAGAWPGVSSSFHLLLLSAGRRTLLGEATTTDHGSTWNARPWTTSEAGAADGLLLCCQHLSIGDERSCTC